MAVNEWVMLGLDLLSSPLIVWWDASLTWLAALWGVPREPGRLGPTGGHASPDREADQEARDQEASQPWEDAAQLQPWPSASQQAHGQVSAQHGKRGCWWWKNGWTRFNFGSEERTLLLQVQRWASENVDVDWTLWVLFGDLVCFWQTALLGYSGFLWRGWERTGSFWFCWELQWLLSAGQWTTPVQRVCKVQPIIFTWLQTHLLVLGFSVNLYFLFKYFITFESFHPPFYSL